MHPGKRFKVLRQICPKRGREKNKKEGKREGEGRWLEVDKERRGGESSAERSRARREQSKRRADLKFDQRS